MNPETKTVACLNWNSYKWHVEILQAMVHDGEDLKLGTKVHERPAIGLETKMENMREGGKPVFTHIHAQHHVCIGD